MGFPPLLQTSAVSVIPAVSLWAKRGAGQQNIFSRTDHSTILPAHLLHGF